MNGLRGWDFCRVFSREPAKDEALCSWLTLALDGNDTQTTASFRFFRVSNPTLILWSILVNRFWQNHARFAVYVRRDYRPLNACRTSIIPLCLKKRCTIHVISYSWCCCPYISNDRKRSARMTTWWRNIDEYCEKFQKPEIRYHALLRTPRTF